MDCDYTNQSITYFHFHSIQHYKLASLTDRQILILINFLQFKVAMKLLHKWEKTCLLSFGKL